MSTPSNTIPLDTQLETPWVLPSRGIVGMVCLICAESAIFLIFVVAYVFYIGKSLSGPTPAQVLELPIVGTICLLSSSITIHWAVAALRKNNIRAVPSASHPRFFSAPSFSSAQPASGITSSTTSASPFAPTSSAPPFTLWSGFMPPTSSSASSCSPSLLSSLCAEAFRKSMSSGWKCSRSTGTSSTASGSSYFSSYTS